MVVTYCIFIYELISFHNPKLILVGEIAGTLLIFGGAGYLPTYKPYQLYGATTPCLHLFFIVFAFTYYYEYSFRVPK